MKRCPYCGAEYIDSMTKCPIDEEALVDVAALKTKSSPTMPSPLNRIEAISNPSRLLSAVGFVVLCGLCGVGLTWIIIALFAGGMLKAHADSFFARSMVMLAAGGALGFAIGLVVARRVSNAGPESIAKLEKRFIRPGDRLRIYFGAPMFVIAVSVALLEPLSRRAGNTASAYIWLGIVLAIIALSLFVHGHLPERSIIPIGITGWLLTILLAIGFGLYMLGIFRHGSAA